LLELEAVGAAAVFALGLRHGIDPDHLAAIGDLVGSQVKARRAMLLATGYALGHAATIIILSVVATWLGQLIPQAILSIMNEIVGLSLVLMGAYLLYSLFRWGERAQLRSRWSLIAQFIRRLLRRHRSSYVEIEHEHPHAPNASHGHQHDEDKDRERGRAPTGSPISTLVRTHNHRHRHVLPIPADPLPKSGVAASAAVGVLHGIGAETPSQIALLATAAGYAGNGIFLAMTFVAGLLLSNTLVAIASVLGLGRLRRGSLLYRAVILVAAGFSIFVGASYLLSG
jgi:hypothetical protein